MKLLLVDDEYYSVEGIKQKIEESDFPADEIFCAYSLADAQSVFMKNKVDILISDIEMPKGSGLELLNWVRQEGYPTVCLLLTSYQSFDYAVQALNLKSSCYLLKPVDKATLIEALKNARAQVLEMNQDKQYKLHAQYWNETKQKSAEGFWHNVASGKLLTSQASMQGELNALHLPQQTLSLSWLPVLIDCKATSDSLRWEERRYENAIRRIVSKAMFLPDETPLIPTMASKQFLVLLYPRWISDPKQLIDALRQLLKSCADSMPGLIHIFPAHTLCDAALLPEVCGRLMEKARRAIYGSHMLYDDSEEEREPIAEHPQWERWVELLLGLKSEQLIKEATDYLAKLQKYPYLSYDELFSFQHDFLQMVYSQLRKDGSLAHSLFSGSEIVKLSDSACGSVDTMTEWVSQIVSAYCTSVSLAARSNDVVYMVKRYVEKHLSDELDRNTIADAVYISPDYLSHVFAEKENVSLTVYITQRRIDLAKELLTRGNGKIRDVALQSGFQNISYFSKQFKAQTGLTPKEYRAGQPK